MGPIIKAALVGAAAHHHHEHKKEKKEAQAMQQERMRQQQQQVSLTRGTSDGLVFCSFFAMFVSSSSSSASY